MRPPPRRPSVRPGRFSRCALINFSGRISELSRIRRSQSSRSSANRSPVRWAEDKISGPHVFYHFLVRLSLNMQHHSVHLSGPPQESAQLAVSIRHKANPAPRECGFHRVPLGASPHKWPTSRLPKIKGHFRLGPVYQLVQSSLPKITI